MKKSTRTNHTKTRTKKLNASKPVIQTQSGKSFFAMQLLEKYGVYLGLGLIFVAASWALFRPDFFRVHDYVHGVRLVEMLRALKEGQFPVRWTSNFGFGYGMPLFEFYGPLPSYVGALFYWLGFDVILSVKLLYLVANLGTVIGAYFLGQRLAGKGAGLVTAALITLSPYRAVNLFVRGALNEAWGIMGAVLVAASLLWLLQRLAEVKNWREVHLWRLPWLAFMSSLLVLFLSHNLMTLMSIPTLALVGFVGSFLLIKGWKQRTQAWVLTASGVVLAGMMAAFYMVPAVLENGYTQIGTILTGYFSYLNHFLYIRQFFLDKWGYGGSAWGPDDGISFFVGWSQLVALGILTLVVVYRGLVAAEKGRFWRRWFVWLGLLSVLVLGCFALSLSRFAFIWSALPFLSFIQFPWRWLGVGVIWLGLLGGLGVAFIPWRNLRWLSVALVVVVTLTNARYFRPEIFLADASGYYYDNPEKVRIQMSDILPDYIPLTLHSTNVYKEKGIPPRQEKEYFVGQTFSTEEAQVLLDRGHEKLFSLNLPQDTQMTLAIAAFPGWQAEIDAQPTSTSLDDNGLLTVDVPAGQHTLGVFFGATFVRYWSDLVSFLALVAVAAASMGLFLPTSPVHRK